MKPGVPIAETMGAPGNQGDIKVRTTYGSERMGPGRVGPHVPVLTGLSAYWRQRRFFSYEGTRALR